MELTHEEWLKIKVWLEEHSANLQFEAQNERNWIRQNYYKEKSSNIKAFLDTKTQ